MANLCKDGADVVVAFFEVFNGAFGLVVIPAVVHDNEAQIKPTTQFKQSVSLLFGPVLIMQVLVIL